MILNEQTMVFLLVSSSSSLYLEWNVPHLADAVILRIAVLYMCAMGMCQVSLKPSSINIKYYDATKKHNILSSHAGRNNVTGTSGFRNILTKNVLHFY